MIVLSVVAAASAWFVARALVRRGVKPHIRQPLVALAYVGVIGAAFVLLPGAERGDIPAWLLWNFRIRAVAGQATLWAVLAIVFGVALPTRARGAASPAPSRAPPLSVCP
jgi:hypothetical protein